MASRKNALERAESAVRSFISAQPAPMPPSAPASVPSGMTGTDTHPGKQADEGSTPYDRLSDADRNLLLLTVAGEVNPRQSPYGTPTNAQEIANIVETIRTRAADGTPLSKVLVPSQYNALMTKPLPGASIAPVVNSTALLEQYGPEIEATVRAAFNGDVAPTNAGLMRYHAAWMNPAPDWSGFTPVSRVGGHIFYEPNQGPLSQLPPSPVSPVTAGADLGPPPGYVSPDPFSSIFNRPPDQPPPAPPLPSFATPPQGGPMAGGPPSGFPGSAPPDYSGSSFAQQQPSTSKLPMPVSPFENSSNPPLDTSQGFGGFYPVEPPNTNPTLSDILHGRFTSAPPAPPLPSTFPDRPMGAMTGFPAAPASIGPGEAQALPGGFASSDAPPLPMRPPSLSGFGSSTYPGSTASSDAGNLLSADQRIDGAAAAANSQPVSGDYGPMNPLAAPPSPLSGQAVSNPGALGSIAAGGPLPVSPQLSGFGSSTYPSQGGYADAAPLPLTKFGQFQSPLATSSIAPPLPDIPASEDPFQSAWDPNAWKSPSPEVQMISTLGPPPTMSEAPAPIVPTSLSDFGSSTYPSQGGYSDAGQLPDPMQSLSGFGSSYPPLPQPVSSNVDQLSLSPQPLSGFGSSTYPSPTASSDAGQVYDQTPFESSYAPSPTMGGPSPSPLMTSSNGAVSPPMPVQTSSFDYQGAPMPDLGSPQTMSLTAPSPTSFGTAPPAPPLPAPSPPSDLTPFSLPSISPPVPPAPPAPAPPSDLTPFSPAPPSPISITPTPVPTTSFGPPPTDTDQTLAWGQSAPAPPAPPAPLAPINLAGAPTPPSTTSKILHTLTGLSPAVRGGRAVRSAIQARPIGSIFGSLGPPGIQPGLSAPGLFARPTAAQIMQAYSMGVPVSALMPGGILSGNADGGYYGGIPASAGFGSQLSGTWDTGGGGGRLTTGTGQVFGGQ